MASINGGPKNQNMFRESSRVPQNPETLNPRVLLGGCIVAASASAARRASPLFARRYPLLLSCSRAGTLNPEPV